MASESEFESLDISKGPVKCQYCIMHYKNVQDIDLTEQVSIYRVIKILQILHCDITRPIKTPFQ